MQKGNMLFKRAMLAFMPLVIAFSLLALPQTTHAATFDPDFGTNGVVTVTTTTETNPFFFAVGGMIVQPDNKIVIAYLVNDLPSLTRLNADGTPDTSFGVNGVFTYDAGPDFTGSFSAVTLSGTSIVAAGQLVDTENEETSALIVRVTDAGVLDTTFNNTGAVTRGMDAAGSYTTVLVAANGSITTFGRDGREWIGARHNADGTPDTGFGTNGLIRFDPAPSAFGINSIRAMAFDTQSSKFYVLGEIVDVAFSSLYAVARFNADGTLDNTFGTNGIFQEKFVASSFNVPAGMHVLPNGRILIAGHYGNVASAIVRLTPAGARDTSFGTGGVVQIEEATFPQIMGDFMVDAGGKLVAVSYAYGAAEQFTIVYRRNANGTPDTSFGNGGQITIKIDDAQTRLSHLRADSAGRYVLTGGVRPDSAWNIVAARLFGPASQLPTAPVLVSPADSVLIVGELPVFSWNTNPASEQVTVYRLTVLDNANVVLRNRNVPAADCTDICEVDAADLGIDFRSGTYRWRVQARNVVGNRNSATRTFTLNIPGTPVLVSPVGQDVPAVAIFRWEVVGAANAYRLEVFNPQNVNAYRSPWLDASALGCTDPGDTCAFEVADGLPNGSYTWRVAARNNALFPGVIARTTRANFRVFYPFLPVLSEPIEDAVVTDTPTPELAWSDTLNSEFVQYRVIVQRPNGTPIYRSSWQAREDVCIADECRYLPTQPLPNGSFRWAVQVRDLTLTAQYVKRTGFATFSLTFPTVPTPISPINGEQVTAPAPQVVFNESVNATQYRIQVRNAVTRAVVFNSGWGDADCNAGLCEFTLLNAIPNGAYQWRVSARNNALAPNISNTPWQDFTVRSPGAPGNLSGSITDTVTWDAADSATEYRVQIQRASNNNQVYTSGWITCTDPTCEHTVDTTLAPREYRWRVQARNVNGVRNAPWVTETVNGGN